MNIGSPRPPSPCGATEGGSPQLVQRITVNLDVSIAVHLPAAWLQAISCNKCSFMKAALPLARRLVIASNHYSNTGTGIIRGCLCICWCVGDSIHFSAIYCDDIVLIIPLLSFSLNIQGLIQYKDAVLSQGVQRSGKSQGNSRLGKSQGKVREFCWRSGKKWILGKVREFAFNAI